MGIQSDPNMGILEILVSKMGILEVLFPCKFISGAPRAQIKTDCSNFKDHRVTQGAPGQQECGVNIPL